MNSETVELSLKLSPLISCLLTGRSEPVPVLPSIPPVPIRGVGCGSAQNWVPFQVWPKVRSIFSLSTVPGLQWLGGGARMRW